MLTGRLSDGTPDAYPPYDFDHERQMQCPRAWHRLKNAFGPTAYQFRDLCVALEVVSAGGFGRQRRMLAIALFDYLDKTYEQQREAERRYWRWIESNEPPRVETPRPSVDKARSDAELTAMILVAADRIRGEGGGRG